MRLHGIAHILVNGAGLTVGAQDEPFVDQVSDVIDQYVSDLLAIRNVLEPLATLRLDGTDFFNGG